MSDRTLGRGRWLQLIDRDGWELVERVVGHAVVCVIALTQDDELVLVEQHRPPLGRSTIELPAGIAGDHDAVAGESIADAAIRELIEETGFAPDPDVPLVTGPTLASSGGLTSEEVAFFLAPRVHRVGPGGGDASESIVTHVVPRRSVHAWLTERQAAGDAVDAKVYSGLALLALHEATPHA